MQVPRVPVTQILCECPVATRIVCGFSTRGGRQFSHQLFFIRITHPDLGRWELGRASCNVLCVVSHQFESAPTALPGRASSSKAHSPAAAHSPPAPRTTGLVTWSRAGPVSYRRGP
jgi:hypothetical protein